MKKEMLCVCRIEGNILYYGKTFEVSDLGKAKREAMNLMKKTGDEYRIYICAVRVDEANPGLFGGFAKFGGYWKMTWANNWQYFNTPKFQRAYVGMEVEVRVMTTTDIKGTIEFGEIIDKDNLTVRLDSGRVIEWNSNPWGSENKTYFHFIGDIYPVPERYKIESNCWQEQDNHIFDRKDNTEWFNSYEEAEKALNAHHLDYFKRIGKRAYGKNNIMGSTTAVKGFEYREENSEGLVFVDKYELLTDKFSEKRF